MHGLSPRRLILLPLLACACQSLYVVPLESKASGALPRHSFVVLKGGTRTPLEGGFFSPDSIVGLRNAGKRFAVPRDSVAVVQERTMSASRSFIALGAAALAGVVLYWGRPRG
jgi:hypothetical protein